MTTGLYMKTPTWGSLLGKVETGAYLYLALPFSRTMFGSKTKRKAREESGASSKPGTNSPANAKRKAKNQAATHSGGVSLTGESLEAIS